MGNTGLNTKYLYNTEAPHQGVTIGGGVARGSVAQVYGTQFLTTTVGNDLYSLIRFSK